MYGGDMCEVGSQWEGVHKTPCTFGVSENCLKEAPPPDQSQAVQQLMAMLPTRPDVGFLRTDPPFLVRFLRVKKFRVQDAFISLCHYYEYRHRQRDLFRGLTLCSDDGSSNPVQKALADGMPGVLSERDPSGRPIMVLMASNWDPNRYDLRTVFQAVLLTLEKLLEEDSVQAAGVVAILDWSNFPLRISTTLTPKFLRLMLDALQDAFPMRLGGIHICNQPWYVEAVLGLSRPFLKEKIRSRIHVHGNNLATLHAHVPPRLLPAELGGERGEYNAHEWAAYMLQSSVGSSGKVVPSSHERNESKGSWKCSSQAKQSLIDSD